MLPARRRPHVQLRQHRHRHVDERHRRRPGQRRRRPGRRRRARGGARRGRRVADPPDRPRRRGRRDADRGRRRRGPRPGQAKRVAKAIVNSPLVKTAVHGADPNWGRVAMAIGKCHDDTDIDQERVVIRFGDREVYPTPVDDAELADAVRRTCAATRSASTSRWHRRRRVHRVGLRPHRRLRPHQRRLHDLTSERRRGRAPTTRSLGAIVTLQVRTPAQTRVTSGASGCRRRRGSSRRSCSCS